MKFILVIFICFIFSISVKSAENKEMAFEHLGVDDGLSNSWILSMHQDSLGFLWFGTSDGLNRYDGHDFTIFRNNKTFGKTLISNNINSICQDYQHHLWLGTNSGVSYFDLEKNCFYSDSLWPELLVNELVYYNDKIIVGANNGLFYINISTNSFHRFSIKGIEILNELNVNAIAMDHVGNLIIATNKGLYIVNLPMGNFYKVLDNQTVPDFASSNFISIRVDHKNGIWLGTDNSSLYYLTSLGDNNRQTNIIEYSRYLSKSVGSGTIKKILEDSGNRIWLAIENQGIVIIENFYSNSSPVRINHVWNNSRNVESLSGNSVYSMLQDRDDNIWIGTSNEGINRYKKTESYFRKFLYNGYESNGLINKNVNTIQKIGSEIWLGTEDGISIFNPVTDQFKNLKIENNTEIPFASNSIWSISPLSQNEVIIGTWAGGAYRYNLKTAKFYLFNEVTLQSQNIFKIMQDSDENSWICTMGGGLVYYNLQKNTSITYNNDPNNPNSLSSNYVVTALENNTNEIWISTTSSIDLFNREKQSFIHFLPDVSNENAIKSVGATMFYKDSKSNIWCATNNGLSCFIRSDSSFVTYQETDGLPSNLVKAVLEDNHGNLWISTIKGLSLLKNATEIPKKPVFKNYDVWDGLQGHEFVSRSAFKDENGWMYFGGTKGFNLFHPDSIHENKIIPKVVLTKLVVANKIISQINSESPVEKDISMADKIRLKSKQSTITITFAALNYIKSAKNQYAYMMEGLNDDWIFLGNEHSVNFTNINPGKYIFKVKASNNDGYWNEKGAQIAIEILPPWYLNVWAYSFYVILFFIAFFLLLNFIVFRNMMNQEVNMAKREQQRMNEMAVMKDRFFTNISHEFRTPLSLIIGPVEKMLHYENFDVENRQFLNLINKNAQRMLRLINQFIDASKIESDYLQMEVHEGDLLKFVKSIADVFSNEANLKGIAFEYISCSDTHWAWFDSDKIEMIIYNLLSNAIKFTSSGGRIEMSVDITSDSDNVKKNDSLIIKIKDSGCGINKEELSKIGQRYYQAKGQNTSNHTGSGIGLSLVFGLVKKYGGTINFESEEHVGTEITVKLPCQKNQFNQDCLVIKNEAGYLIQADILNIEEYESLEMSNFNLSATIVEKPSILIVEDNLELLAFLCSNFNTHYQVIHAKDGIEGKDKALNKMPDIIISDIMMPGIDGIELCAFLKENDSTSHIPIILLTAKTTNEDQLLGLKTGADDYLSKPFSIEILQTKVYNILESRRKLRELFEKKIRIEPTELVIKSTEGEFLKKVLKLINENLSESNFNVEKLSQMVGINRTSLNKKLVALTNLTPNVLIRTIRIKRAAQLFDGGIDNVSEVMYMVGIDSRSYFIKCFKENFSINPSEYVNRIKQANSKSENRFS